MIILSENINRKDLISIATILFDEEMVKAVVDVDRQLIAIDAELHADLEQFLLSDGSGQESLWGINLYPYETGDDLIEYDSLINIRPRQNNRSRGVDDPEIRNSIKDVVCKWIT